MNIDIFIYQDGDMFIAKSMIDGITSQGYSIKEAKDNLKEAVELYYEDENDDFKESIKGYSNLFISKIEINNLKPRFKAIDEDNVKNIQKLKQYA